MVIKKRIRKKVFTKNWLYDYMDESFKDFEYDTFHETMDMMELMWELGNWTNVKRTKNDLVYYIEEYHLFENFEDEATNSEKKRFDKLLKKFGIDKDSLMPGNTTGWFWLEPKESASLGVTTPSMGIILTFGVQNQNLVKQ